MKTKQKATNYYTTYIFYTFIIYCYGRKHFLSVELPKFYSSRERPFGYLKLECYLNSDWFRKFPYPGGIVCKYFVSFIMHTCSLISTLLTPVHDMQSLNKFAVCSF